MSSGIVVGMFVAMGLPFSLSLGGEGRGEEFADPRASTAARGDITA
jgi:hypothetical protein